MKRQTPRIAVFPGSFDPVTNGHVDVIRRGAGLFDELVVGVIENPRKAPLLPLPQRAAIIRQAAARCPNVRVETFAGLTVDFVRRVGASVILRGIRDHSDLQFELQMALTNRVVGGVETVFILPSPEHAFTSSGLIRQIARGGGDVSALVPAEALPAIRRACRAGKARRTKATGPE